MASFDDYLREGRLFDDYNKATLLEKQEVYNKWLELKNSQRAPGTTHLRWHFVLHSMLIDCAAAVVRICVFPNHSFYRKWSYFLSKL